MIYSKTYNLGSEYEFTRYFKDKELTILHREDGPAVDCKDGFKSWWVNEKLHREDGPAIEDVSSFNRYFLNDKEYLEEKYWAIIKFGSFV